MNQPPQRISPVVSVVMPTRNAGPYLRPAVESILNQSFCDFELIVINDASTDETPQILGEFDDNRLIVLTNEKNLGIAASTNRGLGVSRGEYVALQDSDDISFPHRFQAEVEFLDAHPDVALVSSATVTLIDENGQALEEFQHPAQDIDLHWKMLWTCAIHHTGVMARRKAILEVGGYTHDPFFRYGSDYELLSRVAMHHRVVNLPGLLVKWRKHSAQCSRGNQELLEREANVISFRNICALVNGGPKAAASAALTNPEDSAQGDSWLRYLGLRAFLFTPRGELTTLPPEQLIGGLTLLLEIRDAFYREHDFPRSAVVSHRKHSNWTWGKHAVALGIRASWDWQSRIRIFTMGARLLGSWAFSS